MNGGNYFRGEFYGEGAIVWGTVFLGGNFPPPPQPYPRAVVRTPLGSPQKALLLLKVILTAADMRQIAIFVSFQKVLFSTLYISTSLAPTVSQIAAGQYL